MLIPRSKVTGLDKLGGITRVVTYYLNGVQQSQTTQNPIWAGLYYLSTEGWDIDNYHARKKRGDLLPHTPFTQVEYTAERESTSMYDVTVGNSRQTIEQWIGVSGKETSYLDEMDYDLPDLHYFVQSAAANIYSSGHDTLTFLAELKQARRMFERLVPRFVETLQRILRDAKLSNWKALTMTLSNLWLEGRYGWRTLVMDLEDLSEVLQNIDEKRKRYSERSGTSFTDITSDSGTRVHGETQTSWIRTISYDISVRGSVTADISPPKFAFNPVTTAWELTRLSFVIDWLLDVGQALESLSFLALSSEHTASIGYNVDKRVDIACTLEDAPGGTAYTVDGGTSTYTSKHVWTSRSPTTVSSIPHLKLRLNAWKVVDLLALIRQALK